MRKFTGVLCTAALLLGLASLAAAAFPNPGSDNGHGRGHPECHPAPCEPCTQLVDLTPKKKWDCAFACEPIPGCVPPDREG